MAIESGLHWVGDGAFPSLLSPMVERQPSSRRCRWSFEIPPAGSWPAQRLRSDPASPRSCGFRTRAGLRQLSLFVEVTGFADAGNAPVTMWEDISPAGSITVGGSCGPMGSGSGGQYSVTAFGI